MDCRKDFRGTLGVRYIGKPQGIHGSVELSGDGFLLGLTGTARSRRFYASCVERSTPEVSMRFTAIPECIAVLALATLLSAQTKISGTVQCGKSDEQHMLAVGDHPGHSLMISKGKCTWTKPMEIAGTQTKEDVGTNVDDVHGNKSQGHGYAVGTLANGDKMYVHIQGSSTLKDGAVETAEGTWSFTGGTGKLKGVKGKGSYKGKGAPDGSATYEVEGEYELDR